VQQNMGILLQKVICVSRYIIMDSFCLEKKRKVLQNC
jgi:hypothetical protein